MVELEIYNIIAISYVAYSADSIIDVVTANRFNLVKYINTIFDCSKCLSFWVVLLFSGDLRFALLTSLTTLLMQSFIVTKL